MKHAPEVIKPFLNTFNQLARKHSSYPVWEDFLSLYINSWSLNYKTSKDLEYYQKKYTQEERYKFGELMQIFLTTMSNKVKDDNSWFDFLGTFYEFMSLSKKQGYSQFFTPEPICTFMAKIVSPEKRETFSDPCAGSGRFSLAANSEKLGMFHFLMDLDYTCVKMSAINLKTHGIHGIIICQDALALDKDSFKGAFIVNRKLRFTGVPEIEYVNDLDRAYNYVRQHTFCLKTEMQRLENSKTITSKKDIITTNNNDIKELINSKGQYQLF